MEVRLIIALDDECRIYQTLMQGELKDIDMYMVAHYEDSKTVRNDTRLKPKIDAFLEQNQNYRNACSRKNNGYIKLVYTNENGNFCPLKAYYKKDKAKMNVRQVKAQIKRDGIKDIGLMQVIFDKYQSLLSGYEKRVIGNGLRFRCATGYPAAFSNFVERLSKREDGYFQIRQLNRFIEKYNEVKQKKSIKTNYGKIERVDEGLLEQDVTFVQDEPNLVRCMRKVEDPDELFSFMDLDDLVGLEPEEIPDYVKTKKNL